MPIAIQSAFPAPESLRTGDLLFPRPPDAVIPMIQMLSQNLLSPAFNADFVSGAQLNDDLVLDQTSSQIWTASDVGNLLEKTVEQLKDDMQPFKFVENNLLSEAFAVHDLLTSFFPEMDGIFNPGQTLAEFLKNPLAMIFRAGLGGPFNELSLTNFDGHLGPYYIGHVAMVLKQGNEVFVIEANASDFSHYRVALHPYLMQDEPIVKDTDPNNARIERMRGWCNRKLAKGDLIWAARPKLDEPQWAAVKEEIETQAKLMLGRPYDMFDSKILGDDDCIYCSEFIYNAWLKGAGLDLSDQAIWKWVLELTLNLANLSAGATKVLSDLLQKELSRAGIDLAAKFPWMTPKMLYHSQNLDTNKFRPLGQNVPYA
ncbi:YiiX/YebB-like N1pC/P60 family cysteine hydrolase [Undibacterium sp. Ji50W]|uniref:YiiX/YebB-like N1pC/P60 family cysteine hydrolase n=1 Tax=Undibacterium sp. Ji50W TaxID=3413041 RepID=UPI003BF00FA6